MTRHVDEATHPHAPTMGRQIGPSAESGLGVSPAFQCRVRPLLWRAQGFLGRYLCFLRVSPKPVKVWCEKNRIGGIFTSIHFSAIGQRMLFLCNGMEFTSLDRLRQRTSQQSSHLSCIWCVPPFIPYASCIAPKRG